jgi:hypothetical protein
MTRHDLSPVVALLDTCARSAGRRFTIAAPETTFRFVADCPSVATVKAKESKQHNGSMVQLRARAARCWIKQITQVKQPTMRLRISTSTNNSRGPAGCLRSIARIPTLAILHSAKRAAKRDYSQLMANSDQQRQLRAAKRALIEQVTPFNEF